MLRIMRWASACIVVLWTATGGGGAAEPGAAYRIVDTIDVGTVPSWFPVGFCLLTHEESQYVAYYDERHRMVVARRRLGERDWDRAVLPSQVGWDSHNYITMAVDREGYLHLAGNMHCVPLVYFRSRRPGDVRTFEPLSMTGKAEERCTYPRFLHHAEDNLLFTYRSGGSGNGRRFYNRYSAKTKTWSRFIDSPLFEGEGLRNAYPRGPVKGPDGFFHVVWVWRDTPDCATNHHLSYARSRDLRNWETADGRPVTLPLTLGQAELCVDPIPVGGGIINGCERLVFDSGNHPIIVYHKLDENGHMQIYVTRFAAGRWARHPVTAWDRNITFGGRGAMPFIGIAIADVDRHEPSMLSITYRHRDFGAGRIVLDEGTLRPVEREVEVLPEFPKELMRPTIAFKGIHVRIARDLGDLAGEAGKAKYVLRWETLEAHHDRPRQPPLPPASDLQLVKLAPVR